VLVNIPTHTAPRPTATVCGAIGRSMRASRRPLAGSSSKSACSLLTATQTAACPASASTAPAPTDGRGRRNFAVFSSISVTRVLRRSVMKTVPLPTAMLFGRRPT
jgi:hypothetical protein